MSDIRFYYGAASGAQRKALRKLEEPNVLINYATANNEPWNGIDNLFIDSGGYSFMKGKGEYTTSDSEYLDYVERVEPDVFALRDYPCEPDVLQEHNTTVREHQNRTTAAHVKLMDLYDDRGIGAEPVTVVQGWDTMEYARHLRDLHDRGLIGDCVAIGSVCRRGQDQDIMDVIELVRERIGEGPKLHAFGAKTNILRFKKARELLDSADSNSYSMAARMTGSSVCRQHGKCWKVVALYYLQMRERINEMLQEPSGPRQAGLNGFGGDG